MSDGTEARDGDPLARDPLADVTAAVLAGGLGTRLAGVLDDRPKVLAPIAGRPFLDHLLDWLTASGIRRVVLCLGHRAGAVLDHLAGRSRPALEVIPVVEPAPLGTAGALAHAGARLGPSVLALNGDSLVAVALPTFARAAASLGTPAALVAVAVDCADRYGRVVVDGGRVHAFEEKRAGLGAATVNGGIYMLSEAVIGEIAGRGESSLERETLPRLAAAGRLGAWTVDAPFIDIGTPDSLSAAATEVPRLVALAGRE